MRFFKDHSHTTPEVVQEIKKGELQLENLINKYRFILINILFIGDIIAAHFADSFTHKMIFIGLPGLFFSYLVIYRIHRITNCDRPKPALKYITIALDYFFITLTIFELYHYLPSISSISTNQVLLFGTILFIIVNSLSALRIHKHIIIISNVIGILLNSLIHYHFGSGSMIIIYTDVFILLTGIFNQFIGRFVYKFYANNYRLNVALEHVNQANEEIKSQNAELETQNDYLAKQRDQISYQKNQITSSIQYASRIQNALIGSSENIKDIGEDNFILFKPKDIVSGDFYWGKNLITNNSTHQLFAAVDCTGHGVPGAFMSMLGISYLNEISSSMKDYGNPAEILNRLRHDIKKYLHQNTANDSVKDGMDMAIGSLNTKTMTLQFAGANNPLYIIRNNNGDSIPELEEYIADKMPIGIYIKEKESFTNHVIKVNKGDQLYLFSDGYWDQFGGENGEMFKKRRFKELLLSIAHLAMAEQQEKLNHTIMDWMGDKFEQLDDITIIGVKV